MLSFPPDVLHKFLGCLDYADHRHFRCSGKYTLAAQTPSRLSLDLDGTLLPIGIDWTWTRFLPGVTWERCHSIAVKLPYYRRAWAFGVVEQLFDNIPPSVRELDITWAMVDIDWFLYFLHNLMRRTFHGNIEKLNLAIRGIAHRDDISPMETLMEIHYHCNHIAHIPTVHVQIYDVCTKFSQLGPLHTRAPKPISTRDIYLITEMDVSKNYCLHAYLHFVSDKPRWVNVLHEETKQWETIPVLTLLAVDTAGPITVELRGQCAEKLLTKIRKWGETLKERQLIEIRCFQISSCDPTNITHCPPCRIIKSIEGTTVKRILSSRYESIANLALSHFEARYISNFKILQRDAPFKASVRGIVDHVHDGISSQSQISMKFFHIVDCFGKALRCVACGRHTSDRLCIKVGNDIILFFGNAQAGMDGGAGQLWFYDESHIQLCASRDDCSRPPPSGFIEFHAK